MSGEPRSPAVAPVPRILFTQTRAVLVARIRNPAFSVLSLVLPVMFFALFNAIFGQRKAGGTAAAEYILAAYSAYAVASVMVFNFGIGTATERGQKLDVLQRATPLPTSVAAAAQILFSLIFALLALLLLFAYAGTIGGVVLGAGEWAGLAAKLLLGSFPFIALGMAIGYTASPTAAPALANLIFLPMAFVSGIFVPMSQMPQTIQNIGKLLPLYHYGQLAWATVGLNTESLETAALWLAGWAVILFAVGIRLMRLDQARKFA